MSRFAQRCIEKVESLLSENGFSARFERIEGGEVYYKCSLPQFSSQLYVYEDEAGLDRNGKWWPFEKQDFDSGDELCDAFAEGVRRLLVGERELFPGRDWRSKT